MRSSSFTTRTANGRLDKTFWGVPTEPYGFSNGARGVLGSPKFDDATITLDGSDKTVVITLIYHGDPKRFRPGHPRPAYRSDGEFLPTQMEGGGARAQRRDPRGLREPSWRISSIMKCCRSSASSSAWIRPAEPARRRAVATDTAPLIAAAPAIDSAALF